MRQKQGVFSLFLLSPSSRRAWIEISILLYAKGDSSVALLAEGVDRNFEYPEEERLSSDCRPPRGGRG